MIRGSMVAMVTPMQAGGEIDVASLEKLIDFHLAEGSDAIVAVGTTGESATLDENEHLEVIRLVVERVAGRIPVIAGTGANCTREAINLTSRARDAGADASLLVTPYYNKPTQEGLFRHYMAIADAVDIPQILYNVPGRTGCDLLPDTVIRLSAHPRIAGIKEATGDLDRLEELRAACPDDFMLLSGDDATTCEFCLRGGHGVISVTANVAPALMHALCEAAMSGLREEAEAIDQRLSGLHRDLFIESNPIPVKWALARMGLIAKGIRLPLTWMSKEYESVVTAALLQAGSLSS